MNIAINARFLHQPYSGIGQYLLGLLEAFIQSDHEDRLLLYTHLPWELPWEDPRMQLRVLPELKMLPGAGAKKSAWELHQLPAQLRLDGDADLLFIPYPSLTRQYDLPQLTCVHDVIPWVDRQYQQGWLSRIYHHRTRDVLRRAEHLCTVSHFSQGEIAHVLGRDPQEIPVIELGSPFDTLPLPSPEAVEDAKKAHGLNRPYIIYGGGYDARKGVDHLIQSFEQYVAPTMEVDLVLVGHPLFATGLYTNPLGTGPSDAKGQVRSIGFIDSNQELFALYRGAILCAHFSSYEGFNLPLLQACKAGVASVAFPLPPHVELFSGAFESLLKGTEQAVWQRMLQDHSYREAMAAHAREVGSRYHFSQTLEKLHDYWQQILKSN